MTVEAISKDVPTDGDRAMDALFNPRGIAVVGASADLSRIGGQPIQALLAAGYRGRIYPVNPKYAEVGGLRCYGSIAAIDGPCDLAVIALPAAATPQAIRSCGAAGIRHAVVFSGGFRESGAIGAALEDDLLSTARETGVRVVGPNCQGFISVASRVFAVFGAVAGDTHLLPGSVSMMFQSGGFGFSIVTLCDAMGIRFRHCVSVGNETDVTTPELIDVFLDDPGTRIICAYIEGVGDGRALMAAAARAVAIGKPLIVWKGGKSEVGARAAVSHTGNMTGRYDIYRAAMKQVGIIEAHSVEEMVDMVHVLSLNRVPKGRKAAALGISGGSGIVFADAAVEAGLELPVFAPSTIDQLSKIIPAFGSVGNPADITASIFNDTSRFTGAVEVVLSDPSVDQLALLLASLPGKVALETSHAIALAHAKSDKPILIGWSARRERAEEAYRVLEAAGVPILPTPERVARAAGILARYAQIRHRGFTAPIVDTVRVVRAGEGPAQQLSEFEGKRLLESFGIPLTRDAAVPTGGDFAQACAQLAFPVAAKIISPDLPHKTELGAVRLDLRDLAELETAAYEIYEAVSSKTPNARVEGILVSEMITDGIETLVGVINDPTFGPTVAFALGGIFTEVLHDVTYRVAPFDLVVAREMIGELRGRALFEGMRGKPALDVEALAATLAAISRMAWALRDRLLELDINPLFVRPSGRGVAAGDCLAVLSTHAEERVVTDLAGRPRDFVFSRDGVSLVTDFINLQRK